MYLRLPLQSSLMQLTITSWVNKMPFPAPDIPRSHLGEEGKIPCSLIPTPWLARFFFYSRRCQEKAFCAMLCPGPLTASRHGQLENGNHFKHISNPKQLFWEAFSSLLALVLLHVCLQQARPNVIFLSCFFNKCSVPFRTRVVNWGQLTFLIKGAVSEKLFFIKHWTSLLKIAREKDLGRRGIHPLSQPRPLKNDQLKTAYSSLHTLIDLIFHMASFCLGG